MNTLVEHAKIHRSHVAVPSRFQSLSEEHAARRYTEGQLRYVENSSNPVGEYQVIGESGGNEGGSLLSENSMVTPNGSASSIHFGNVDWNFPLSYVKGGIHAIHPYPARFIPEIPRKLIELYSPSNGGIVLDPFCGSGTTIVESIQSGYPACGIDLNPLACLIARVKCSASLGNLEQVGADVIERAMNALSVGRYSIPEIPRLDHWFKAGVQESLTVLMAEIQKVNPLPLREGLMVALSSIVVRVSNQESDTRYAAIEKRVGKEDVFRLFAKSVSAIWTAHDDISLQFTPRANATIINADILTVSPKDIPGPVELVITSPPYPNAYEYWLYHKYRMYWLGMDPIAVRQREIGARPNYFGKNPQDEGDFELQMSKCFKLLASVMSDHGKVCFLIGRSIIHGREINNSQILERAASRSGFLRAEMAERKIMRTRKSFNPAHSKINEEKVMVFSREGFS